MKSGSYPQPYIDIDDLQWCLYERLGEICDPEFNKTLEQLNVITDESIIVTKKDDTQPLLITIKFTPTVPHCSYASLIGLTLLYTAYLTINEINFNPPLPSNINGAKNGYKYVKFCILLSPGSHNSEIDLNKQLNDKERVSCALNNPVLLEQVHKLIPNELQCQIQQQQN